MGVVGFFPGVWDLVHLGHIRALKEARGKCDYLIIGLQTDPTIDRPEKNKPILSVEEREEMLYALGVDLVATYTTEKELHECDRKGGYDIRFMGADHKGKKHHEINAKIVYVSRDHDYSTENLRKRIYEAEIERHLD